jgi:Uma2 family endonuclease
MSIETSTITTEQKYSLALRGDEEILYAESDENIMPEGILHFLLSVRLASTLLAFFAKREDVKVFGNCMLYYEKGNPKKVVSPDLMICFGLEKTPKRVYKLWEEKIIPSVVIEFASETTWFNDVSTKLALYQKLGVKEYYVFDVEYDNLPESLLAYRLIDDELQQAAIEKRKILSDSLNLELVDTGETLRFFNPETNEFLMTAEEMQAENEKLKAELAKLKK